MGQQQLLLIILGVIVVGIAVAVGITMFKDNAVSANRDAVTNDLVNLAARAQQYYRRPTALGGGQGSFLGLTQDAAGLKKLTSMPNGTNANGTYTISAAGTSTTIQLQGLGVEMGNDGSNPVKVIMDVWADSAKVAVSLTN
jgi:Tfp pilus assembly protein PilE